MFLQKYKNCMNYTAKGIKLYNMNSHDLQVVDKIKQGNSGL